MSASNHFLCHPRERLPSGRVSRQGLLSWHHQCLGAAENLFLKVYRYSAPCLTISRASCQAVGLRIHLADVVRHIHGSRHSWEV